MINGIFFEPWVGPQYEKGINFSKDGHLIFKKGNDWYCYVKENEGHVIEQKVAQENLIPNIKPLKVAILGKEHYCETQKDCENRNFEQHFYMEILENVQNKLKNREKIQKYLETLTAYQERIKEQAATAYNDKLYVLHKECGWPLKMISKELGLSKIKDLYLYMAIEKILTIYVAWNNKRETQIQQIIDAINDFKKFKAQAQQHRSCHMHTTFLCPLCGKEEMECCTCEQIPICHYKTRRQLYNYAQGIETDSGSHGVFRKVINHKGEDTAKIWNHLLFTNYYQCSMPSPQTNNNAKFRSSASVQQAAIRAFSEIVKQYTPDVIITWGKENKEPAANLLEDQKNGEVLHEAGLEILLNPHGEIPRINLVPSPSDYIIPFTVLKDKKAHKDCLVIFLHHPAWTTYKHKEKEYQEKNYQNLICFFKHYNQLMKWDHKLPVYDPQKKHFTCEFDEHGVWNTANLCTFPKLP